MAHNLYAQLPEDALDAYYDVDRRKMDIADIEGYGHSMPPSIGAKIIRDSDWLPAYITDGVYQAFTPEQAKMYADSINRALVYGPDDIARQVDYERLLDIVGWLNYWAGSGVAVEGAP